uniref:Helicase ATP-binding domain-containing protein n=1 Tax=Ditylenchus dipsaci TaxID=166011 RepID=A0A915EC05_9BILA
MLWMSMNVVNHPEGKQLTTLHNAKIRGEEGGSFGCLHDGNQQFASTSGKKAKMTVCSLSSTDDIKSKGDILEAEDEIQNFSNDTEAESGTLSLLTKSRQLALTDHSKVYYRPFRKDFYVEVPELAKMTKKDVEEYRHKLEETKFAEANVRSRNGWSYSSSHVTNSRTGTTNLREANKIAKHVGIRAVCIYGGVWVAEQIGMLKNGAEIIVCTPGRLTDVLAANSGNVTNLRRVTYLVLDEADRIRYMGFEPQVMKIVNNQMEALARKVFENLLKYRLVAKASFLQELLAQYWEFGNTLVFVDKQEKADDIVMQTHGHRLQVRTSSRWHRSI